MTDRTRRRIKRIAVTLAVIGLLIVCLSVWFHLVTRISPPEIQDKSSAQLTVENPAPDFYRAGRNWLQKNRYGLWEMYLEGEPFERGVINGKLSKHLLYAQEKAFVDQIREMVPSDFYLRFLKYFIYWFNRNLDAYIPGEYKEEIYGISLSAPDEFAYIGSNYQRMLNYHSAHDIGHALQDYRLVGCTSFGVWKGLSKDSSLLIGRNFDFYAGDAFAENKIVCFEKPTHGYGFMMVTWGGMIGAVSGMNMAGLTVTINAARSEIPGSARTPISLLAREILQYASTIDEAYAIAKKRETFVSESLLIGSAKDNRAAVIEKSPSKIALYLPASNLVSCANHFQSHEFSNDPLTILDKRENASVYRQLRLEQKLSASTPIDHRGVAAILRDRKGLNGADIGVGNEKALNQMIAHHSVIFKPGELLVWVSTAPWQSGPYVCYNLNEIFNNFAGLRHAAEVTEPDKTIPPDTFLLTDEYQRFKRFREMKRQLVEALGSGKTNLLTDEFIEEFRNSNPMYYEVYELLGDFNSRSGSLNLAEAEYRHALSLEIPRWNDKELIIKKLVKVKNQTQ